MKKHAPAHIRLGRYGEACAARLLRYKGYEILGRDIRFGNAQVDLAARDGETFVIVEVKTLRYRKDREQDPGENLSSAQTERLRKAGYEMMRKLKNPPYPLRFDLVEVIAGPWGTVRSIRILRDFLTLKSFSLFSD